MRTADNKIVVVPLFGNLGKNQRRIASGHHNGILLNVLGCLRFCKTCSSVNGVEQKIIIVGRLLSKGKFVFTGVTEFLNIEWKSFCNVTLFCSFPCGKFRKRTVRCAHVNTPKSEKCYLCKLSNDIISFSV